MKKCLIILSLLLLASCAKMGMVGKSTQGYYNNAKKSVASVHTDHQIYREIRKKISNDSEFKDSHIVITSLNHIVLLTGQTPKATLRIKAEKHAHRVPNVVRIYNEIQIASQESTMTELSDDWITTKTKTFLTTAKGLRSHHIKVLTENGVVYLMGKVNQQQANMAVEIARSIKGVQKVVRVFEYS